MARRRQAEGHARRQAATVLPSLKGLFPFRMTFPSAEALGYFRGSQCRWREKGLFFAKNGHFPQKLAAVCAEHGPVSGEHRPVFHAHRAVSDAHGAVSVALRAVFQRLLPGCGEHRQVPVGHGPVSGAVRPVSREHSPVSMKPLPEFQANHAQPRTCEGRFQTGHAEPAAPLPARLLEKADPRVLGARNAKAHRAHSAK